MKQPEFSVEASDGFALKNRQVELIRRPDASASTGIALGDLEAMRIERSAVPASRYGLEAICGASCEIGAH